MERLVLRSWRCLKELAKIYKRELPLAVKVVEQDFYMDDALTGESTLKNVMTLQEQLTELLARGKFPLRKWRANNQNILKHLTECNKADSLLVIDKDQPLKTLRLLWNANMDTLQYRVELEDKISYTKRDVLSKISQVFDPLGLIAPVLIVEKIIMQKMWKQAISWDQELPVKTT